MGKHKIKVHHGIKSAYKHYKNQLSKEDKKSSYKISQKLYHKIVYSFHQKVSELMINKSFEFRMFSGLGDLSIGKYKVKLYLDDNGNVIKKYLKINIPETVKLRKNDEEARKQRTVVYFDNKHTDGYKFFWHWSKISCNAKNIKYYKFKASRKNNRDLAAILLNPNSKVDFYDYTKT